MTQRRTFSFGPAGAADALWIFALACLSIVAHGHNFGVGNDVISLLWIERLRDPAFLLNDWYLSTAPMYENTNALLRVLGDRIGDANAFLAGLLATRTLLFSGIWLLARALGGGRIAGTLACVMIVLAPRVSLGGHFATGAFFVSTMLGAALSACAAAMLARRRFFSAGVFVGIAGHCHIFWGAHMGAAATLAILLMGGNATELWKNGNAGWRQRWEETGRHFAAFAAPALAIASYAIWQTLTAYFGAENAGGLTGAAMVDALAFRHPHHHSPFAWNPLHCALAAAYLALGAGATWRVGRARDPVFLAIYLYGIGGMIVGTVFVELVPIPFVAMMQFFRFTVMIMVWTTAAWAVLLCGLVCDACARRRWWGVPLVWLTVAFYRAAYFFPPVALVALGLTWLGPGNPKRGAGAAQATGEGAGSTQPISACVEPAPSPVVGVASSYFPFAAIAAVLSFALLIAGAIGALNPPAARMGRPEHFRLRAESPSHEVRALAQWARENTPENAVFLAPPGMEEFSLAARRAEVVSFKLVPFTGPAMREWLERIVRVSRLGHAAEPGLPEEQWGDPGAVAPALHEMRMRLNTQIAVEEGYELLRQEDVAALENRYHFDYFIAKDTLTYEWPIAGAAGGYVIYRAR